MHISSLNIALKVSLVAAALMTASAASAVVTIVQTLNFSSAVPGSSSQAFNQYNVAGSTLTAVTFSWTETISGPLTITSSSGNSRTLNATVSADSVLSSNAFNLTSTLTGTTPNFVLGGRGTSAATSVTATGTNTITPASVTPFLGSGTVIVLNSLNNLALTLNKVAGGSGNAAITGATISSTGTLVVTYTGTDVVVGSVPEPGTWAMMITGFGLVGMGMRRARAVAPARTA